MTLALINVTFVTNERHQMKLSERYHMTPIDKAIWELFVEWCNLNGFEKPKQKLQEIMKGVSVGKMNVIYNVIEN